MRALVSGGAGFIGGFLVKRLLDEGHDVVAVDIKPESEWWQVHDLAYNWPNWDLREYNDASGSAPFDGVDVVYHLAADMGGRGYIHEHEADCAVNAVLDVNVLRASVKAGVKRFMLASSACVYPITYQSKALGNVALNEAMGEPPWEPDDVYGLAKLYAEQATLAFAHDHGLDTRIARFHGVYGPHGDWGSGKEKAPAAVCRKVAKAQLHGEPVVLWGDATQRRSFMEVSDAVDGIMRLMDCQAARDTPVNLGSSELVTIKKLAETVQEIAGLHSAELSYDLTKPTGPHGRSSDNTLIRKLLGWEPQTTLRDGLEKLYPWVLAQVEAQT